MKMGVNNVRFKLLRITVGAAAALFLLSTAQAQTTPPPSLLITNSNFIAGSDLAVPGLTDVYFGGNLEWPSLAEDGTVLFRSNLYGTGTAEIAVPERVAAGRAQSASASDALRQVAADQRHSREPGRRIGPAGQRRQARRARAHE